MQTAVVFAEIPYESEISELATTPMTYQLTMRGSDGMVIASDQCERTDFPDGNTPVSNPVRKISTLGRFAWAYWNGPIGPTFSSRLEHALLAAGKSRMLM